MPSAKRRLRSKQPRVIRKAYRQLLIEPLEGRLLLTAITVTTASDAAVHSGISLRDAIGQANTDAKAGTSDTITFDPSLDDQTITLGQGQLELGQGGAGSGTITIQGDDHITISGDSTYRVFQIDTGVTAQLSHLTIENGNASDTQTDNGADGGGLLNLGTLTITQCVISNNTASDEGGGIYSEGTLTIGSGTTISSNTGVGVEVSSVDGAEATLTATDSTISDNTGGAAYQSGRGTLAFTNCIISGNSATSGDFSVIDGDFDGYLTLTQCTISDSKSTNANPIWTISDFASVSVIDSTIANNAGIGIYNGLFSSLFVSGSTISANDGSGILNDGTATITGSTISDNSETDGAAGGIDNEGTATITGSTITGNSGYDGGGIGNSDGGVLTLTNSTVSGNTASGGAGIDNDFGATLTVSNSTIAGNIQDDEYGFASGIFNGNSSDNPRLTLLNTIVAANQPSGSSDVWGAVTSTSSNNLIGDGSGLSGLANGINGNQVGTDSSPIDPLLGPLQINGGSTQTMAPQPGSSAIGQGGALTTTTLTGLGVGAADTTVGVVDAAAIASTPGNYVIQIDGEQILVTNVSASNNTLTVTRGYNGTTAAHHDLGAGVYLANDQIGQSRPSIPDIGAFQTSYLEPNVTPATTIENEQTTTGLVVTASTVGGDNVMGFQITGITGGTLFFQNDGTLFSITDGGFINTDEGIAGLRFTPDPNSTSPGSFIVQQSTTGDAGGLEVPKATAQITVLSPLHAPSVTGAVAQGNAQTTSGLVIKPNSADLGLVMSFQITDITGGTLFLSDGSALPATHFIDLDQGVAGLKFTPTPGSNVNGSFVVQESFTSDETGLGGPTSEATITRLVVWTGAGDGKAWNMPANWDGAVPISGNDVQIESGGGLTVFYDASDGNTTLSDLTLGPNVTLSITGGSLTATGNFSVGGVLPLSGPVAITSGSVTAGTSSATFTDVAFNLADGGNAAISAGTFLGTTTLDVGQNATLQFEGKETISGTLTGSGSGTVELAPFEMLLGLGGLTVNFSGSMLQWTGGEINAGNGDLTNLGVLNLPSDAEKDFYNDGLLDNFGTVVQSGTGNLVLGTDSVLPATFEIEAGASYLIEANSGTYERANLGDAPGQVSLVNQGLIRKTAGTGTSTLFMLGAMSNTGTIEVDSGTIVLAPDLGINQISAHTLTAGTWSALNGAELDFPGSITANAATLSLAGAGAKFVGISALSSNTGQLSLSGGATFTTAGNFTNTGTLTVGTASVLTIHGNFSQSAPGALDDQIGGTPGSGLFGKIAVGGSAALGGVFNLALQNGFTPVVGQSFPDLSFASETGNFASLSGLKSLLSESLTSTSLGLVAANAADLAVGNVTGPTGGTAGQSITVSWQVTDSSGQAASGSWQDSVYLSATPTITAGSILLGATAHTAGLGAGSSYNASLTANLPAVLPGTYYLLVQADSLSQSPDSNRTNNTAAAAVPIAVSLPTLALDTPLAGSFTAPQQSLYYQVSVPIGGSLSVALASAAGSGGTALYVSQGTLPTPYSYQYAANVANQPNQSLTVPQTLAATTYYILAESISGAAATAGFTLSAMQTSAVSISALSTSTGGNSGNITVEIDGTNFKNSATASLKLGGTTSNAASVDFVSSGQLFATFNLSGAAVGGYTLSVQQDAQTATAPKTFQVVAAAAAPLAISLSVPSAIRPGHAGTIVISYTNTSDNDIVAPLLQITSTNSSTLFSTPDDPNDFVSSAELLAVASNGPAGIVRPGQSGSLMLTMLSDDTVDGDQIPIEVSQIITRQTINWTALQAALQPSGIPTAAWNVIYANLLTIVGSTTDSYNAALAQAATYLGDLGEAGAQISDVSRLLSFLIGQADAAFPSAVITSPTDTILATAGPLLGISRTFSAAISQRYTPGIFGLGWVTSWQASLSIDGSGNVTLDSGGTLMTFSAQPNGEFLAAGGQLGMLTQSAGIYTYTVPGMQYVFRADGLLSYEQDVDGNRITLGYNAESQLVSLTYSDAFDSSIPTQQLTLSYNPQGFVSQVADGTGSFWTYSYDNAGHLLSVVAPGGFTTAYTYDTSGNPETENALVTVTSPGGSQEVTGYDPTTGRVIMTSLNGAAAAVTYTYLGEAEVMATDSEGGTTIAWFNDLGVASRVQDPLGGIANYQYDTNGNLLSETDAVGSTYRYTYDANGNLAQITNPLGQTEKFTSDSQGDMTSSTDAAGNTTQYAYDSADDLLSITYPDGTSQSFSYDPLGNLSETVEQNGDPITFQNNAQGLITRQTFADGTSQVFYYDANGNLLTASSYSSSGALTGTTSLTYSAADELLSITYPNGQYLDFTYNAAGQRSQSTDQDGFTVNYAYDALGRFSELTDGSGNLIVQYTYNAADKLQEKLNGNGTRTTYTYDAAADLTSEINYADAAGTIVNSSFTYTYNVLGEPTSMTDNAGNTTTYGYDALGQLTQVGLPSGQAITYVYDAAGDRTQVINGGTPTSYSTNSVNEVTQVGSATYTYDANGNLHTTTDASGTTVYGYNDENQLVSITNSDGSVQAFQYSPLGFLVATSTTSGGITSPTNYLVDPSGADSFVASYDGSGSLVDDYVYGLGLVGSFGSSGAGYYDFDATGNTVGISNASGAYENQYSYLPFGETTVVKAAQSNPFTFAGKFGVVQLGSSLFAMGARVYTPATGQFLSNDPLGLDGGDMDLRLYVGNAPTMSVDPTGNTPDNLRDMQSTFPPTQTASGVPYFRITGSDALALAAKLKIPFGEVPGDVPGTVRTINAVTFVGNDGNAYTLFYGWPGDDTREHEAQHANDRTSFGFKMRLWSIRTFNPGVDDAHATNLLEQRGYQAGLDNADANDNEDKEWDENQLEEIANNPDVNINRPVQKSEVRLAQAHDPNALIGPAGYGLQGFVQPSSSNLPYTVDFENDGSAPAQVVTVTEQLDANLDWSTFQLGSFGFGPVNVAVPAGLTQYQTTVGYQNQDGSALNVLVTFDFNVATGLLTATFTSLDPLTGQAPAGVFDGFLPTDDSSHVGEGYVQYTVQPTAGLTTGATIGQQAAVVFDTNTPIPTNTFTNTIDSGAPTSSVATLPAESPEPFVVNWSGSDDAGGSGVASYDVYVSDNGGAYMLWQDQTTQTFAAYAGIVGDTYSFYSVATDNVGNVEGASAIAEATTLVTASVVSQTGSTLTVTCTSPNDSVVIEFDKTFSTVRVEFDGVLENYSTSNVNNIVVDGVSGNNTLTVDSPPTETATVALTSGSLAFTLSNFTISSTNTPNIFYYAKIADTATLTDPAGANTLTVTPGYEQVTGSGLTLTVIGGGQVAAYSNGSGLDTAVVQAASSQSYTAYVGHSVDSGQYPNGYYYHSEYGFANVYANDNSGLVTATLFGNGSSAFQDTINTGTMASAGYFIEVYDFGQIDNVAGGAGDTIQLTTVGSSGFLQEFVAGEHAAYINEVGVANSKAAWADGFTTVTGVGAGANTEVVFLPGTGNSNLTALGNAATMSTAAETNIAKGFARGTAYSSSGTNTDDIGVLDYVLEMVGGWIPSAGINHGTAT